MSPARTAPRRRRALVVGACAAVGVLLSGCTGGVSAPSGSKNEINYALPANFTPNWIVPIGTPG
ncbi:peptide ABC transporter substrate-binding protein, partial [Streptomyces sp. SID5926]|nr:peptide ABC transporter substrate-binding protein [Streptomyces sp. SID5926]